jgi:hypothetical protein
LPRLLADKRIEEKDLSLISVGTRIALKAWKISVKEQNPFSPWNPYPIKNEATETFRTARVIAPHAGIVKRNLRLFDELANAIPRGS